MLQTCDPNNHWLNGHPDDKRSVCDLAPGRLYRFRGMRLADQDGQPGPWRYRPGIYRLIGCGKNTRTWQDEVAYQSQRGELFFCALADWQRNFTPLEAKPVEKLAGPIA